ncbi:hypothetical protein [Clostridium cochlearium]|uniref:hypothetical protein n=1 Tax=Clostridium cochlearium TaxID=1494 RepID=UPI00241DB295|nr:hypothetical protein [Clostridium cochlearium]MBE6065901.1 hypothetical protein [Clostridium cochlearium]
MKKDKKNIQKSVKITEEAFNIISGQVGNSFNEQLHNLIFLLNDTINKREDNLNFLNNEIDVKQKELNAIKADIAQHKILLTKLKSIEKGVDALLNLIC